MAEQHDTAFLLRRVSYGDSSCIIHILGRVHGRLTLMARGARRAKSPFRAALEPLHELQLAWRPGRTGMGTLVDAERGAPMADETRSLEGLQLSALAAQLFREGDPHGFSELQHAFALLSGRKARDGLLAGAWSLLSEQGLLGPLDHCWQCGRESTTLAWHAGECRCPSCGGGQGLSMGLRRAIPALMQSPQVTMPVADLTMWAGMIQDVLRLHGIRPINYV